MTQTTTPVEIPKRALFKAAEVCDLVNVQPYVLRTWEAEFPDLGVAKPSGGPRVYRRTDVERVVRIKHLLLVEGLTLAGARKRLDDEAPLTGTDVPLDELIGQNARERITDVKRGLRDILDLLARRYEDGPRAVADAGRPIMSGAARTRGRSVPGARVKVSRTKSPVARNGGARRKRSA